MLNLFQDCILVMRRDVQTCLFLMPYVIHNVLSAGQDAARQQVAPPPRPCARRRHRRWASSIVLDRSLEIQGGGGPMTYMYKVLVSCLFKEYCRRD